MKNAISHSKQALKLLNRFIAIGNNDGKFFYNAMEDLIYQLQYFTTIHISGPGYADWAALTFDSKSHISSRSPHTSLRFGRRTPVLVQYLDPADPVAGHQRLLGGWCEKVSDSSTRHEVISQIVQRTAMRPQLHNSLLFVIVPFNALFDPDWNKKPRLLLCIIISPFA